MDSRVYETAGDFKLEGVLKSFSLLFSDLFGLTVANEFRNVVFFSVIPFPSLIPPVYSRGYSQPSGRGPVSLSRQANNVNRPDRSTVH